MCITDNWRKLVVQFDLVLLVYISQQSYMHKQEDKMINFKVDAEKIKLFSVNSWNILYTKLKN